ncbi:CRISPR-associated endoribonuclease Cas6 [Sediminitomix flava]|uniref:CRISPR-associated endoribonuclease Cas6 n=1 Tax=Sediminitomix flava TaxID=379075 RepID=A0A315ZGJ5_SEDFL|nr:CRISPR-associated endoribonuclease Cas6 [Sediminitomix flava]PWJ43864.1 CRISPR-associated endoribonuclease Cas6 [Sediminitomix flava]
MTEYSILFKQVKGSHCISYNIAFVLSQALNKNIGKVDPKAGDFAHNEGHKGGHRNFKLWTHSIMPKAYDVLTEGMLLQGEYLLEWRVRFYDRYLAKAFEKALILCPEWEIVDRFGIHHWQIIKSEPVLHQPSFNPVMSYKLITPAVISIPHQKTRKPFYLTFRDHKELIPAQIQKHLQNKAQTLYNLGAARDGMEEGLEDMSFKLLNTPKTKRLTFKETQNYSQKVFANQFEFELIAPVEVHKLIYYGGFLEKTARGCGFLKIRTS